MVYKTLGKKSISLVLAMAFAVSGCMPGDVASGRQESNALPVGESTTGSGSGATTSGTGSGTTTSILPKVEIRHLIEPNLSYDPTYTSGTGYAGGGSYVRKLTLPKNFAGKLYLAGINIGTLADKHVKVRFKFGVNREAVTIPAIVSQAPGITPQTNISVLVMDMRPEYFRNVRLSYDLFDYNTYTGTQTPVQDNRDTGLYCRGLQLADDPTFTGVGQCDGAPSSEECLYSYAKVLDQGLVKEVITNPAPSYLPVTSYVPLTPSLIQAKSTGGVGYYQDSIAAELKKPLADNILGPFKFSEVWVPGPSLPIQTLNFFSGSFDWTAKYINGSNYYYRGPYRLVNTVDWHYKDLTLTNPKGLFKSSTPYTGPAIATPTYGTVYFESLMFPLATKLDLQANVDHLSSTTYNAVRSASPLSVAGKTEWMDGSNIRANSKNSDLEHVGSCNVSATIEIIAKDNNLNDYVVALANDVKIQLVRPIQHYTDTGNDVLYTNFKTCSSNATCGGSECCFNNRCWDETLVSQCYDTSASQGNHQVGESCGTDLDCTSLCCNRTSGLCSPHNTLLNPAVLCSKPIGDFCIAKEWCQKTAVIKYLIVKTGVDIATGAVTCRLQPYTTLENGDCLSGVCTPPFQESAPAFDPANPDCTNAVTAPNF